MKYLQKAPFLIIIACAISLIPGCSKSIPYTKNFVLMDTVVSIQIRDSSSLELKKIAVRIAMKRMKELEKQFNYFGKRNELVSINMLKKGEKFYLSNDAFDVLRLSRNLCKKTEGAFDVSVGALVEFWSSARESNVFPNVEEVENAKNKVGLNAWILNEAEKSIMFMVDGAKIDLSSVAKGFIVDEGIRALKNINIETALINAGGDMYCLGTLGESGWRVGIRDPKNPKKIIMPISVSNGGVATSGGYERFAEFNKTKFSHIIDPKSGYLVKNVLSSATVVARDCATADALATALYVLGPKKGVSLIERMDGVECAIVDESGRLYISSGLRDGIVGM